MTKEELQVKADELGQKYFPDADNIWARENYEAKCVSHACIEMAKFVEEKLMLETYEFLKYNTWRHISHPDEEGLGVIIQANTGELTDELVKKVCAYTPDLNILVKEHKEKEKC